MANISVQAGETATSNFVYPVFEEFRSVLKLDETNAARLGILLRLFLLCSSISYFASDNQVTPKLTHRLQTLLQWSIFRWPHFSSVFFHETNLQTT